MSKKTIFLLIILVLLIIAIPLGLYLLQKQQQLKSRAAEEAQNQIKFTGTGVNCDNQGRCTTTNDKVDLELLAPWPAASGVPVNTSQNPHVYTLEVDNNIDSTDGIRFDLTAKLFYQNNPSKINEYDFIAIFPAFRPQNESGYAGLHSNVQNDVRGICRGIKAPNLEMWGSTKLKSVQIYPFIENNYSDWLNNVNESGRLLLEETAHQWLISIGKLHQSFPPGTPPDGINPSCLSSQTQLLLEDDRHWSKGLAMNENVFGAMREARPWRDNGDGTFSYDPRLYYEPKKFHPFDLYLMGLVDKSDVKGEFLLLADMDNPDSVLPIPPGSGTSDSRPGLVTTHARATRVTIDDVIRIAGEERRPGVSGSQKDFKVTFVILYKANQRPNDTLIKAINAAANAFSEQWLYATANKSTMNKN